MKNTKSYNICIVKPENYPFSYAFTELAELVCFSLREIGFEANIKLNKISRDEINIIFGCHLLGDEYIGQIPKGTIIFNTEQIGGVNLDWNNKITRWAKNFKLWDYSKENIRLFSEKNIDNITLFEIGYQKELARLEKVKIKDVDILFYGSVNERRKKILDELKNKGLIVKTLFGVFGKERDQWIERSKVVLNHHYYNSQIFEIVRVFFLLTNSIPVVGELNNQTVINDMFRQGIYGSEYNELVASCLELVECSSLREKIADNAFETISRYPQKAFTLSAVENH